MLLVEMNERGTFGPCRLLPLDGSSRGHTVGPPGGEAATLAQNGSINIIYMCDACEGALPGGQSFVSVIDAIQGDGFNPLWLEVQITFDTIAPKQFTSDEDILEAADAGEITLTPTTEVYRCSVIGPKD